MQTMILMCLVLALAGCGDASGQEKPTASAPAATYQGKTLDEWMVASRDNDRGTQKQAVEAIATFDDDRAIVRLRELAKDEYFPLRMAAAHSLRGKDSVASLRAYLTCLKDLDDLAAGMGGFDADPGARIVILYQLPGLVTVCYQDSHHNVYEEAIQYMIERSSGGSEIAKDTRKRLEFILEECEPDRLADLPAPYPD